MSRLLGYQLRLPVPGGTMVFPLVDAFYVSREVAELAKKYLELADDWYIKEVWSMQ